MERSGKRAIVTRVIDGDTIDVNINGVVQRVRYIGIDTPEYTSTKEYYGAEATAKNRSLVEGRTVTLVKDVSETDRYDRLLRYVLVGNVFVNYELVRLGFATAGNLSAGHGMQLAVHAELAKASQGQQERIVEANQNAGSLCSPTPIWRRKCIVRLFQGL
jgi:endonuclease YncB( thermonuclease family)